MSRVVAHRAPSGTFYRGRWTEADGTVVVGPSRTSLEEAVRDDPGHPIRKDAGGPQTRARSPLPNEPRFRPLPEPIVSRTARRLWGAGVLVVALLSSQGCAHLGAVDQGLVLTGQALEGAQGATEGADTLLREALKVCEAQPEIPGCADLEGIDPEGQLELFRAELGKVRAAHGDLEAAWKRLGPTLEAARAVLTDPSTR